MKNQIFAKFCMFLNLHEKYVSLCNDQFAWMNEW